MSFPILSIYPSFIEKEQKRNTIEIEFDGGYKQARERNTRDLHIFAVTYLALPKDDFTLLEGHSKDMRGATPFSWYNPADKKSYNVRYSKYPTKKGVATVQENFNVEFELEEV